MFENQLKDFKDNPEYIKKNMFCCLIYSWDTINVEIDCPRSHC